MPERISLAMLRAIATLPELARVVTATPTPENSHRLAVALVEITSDWELIEVVLVAANEAATQNISFKPKLGE